MSNSDWNSLAGVFGPQGAADSGLEQADRAGGHRAAGRRIPKRPRERKIVIGLGDVLREEHEIAPRGAVAEALRALWKRRRRSGARRRQHRAEHARVEPETFDALGRQALRQRQVSLPIGDRMAGLIVTGHEGRAEQRGEIGLIDLHPDRARFD
jgi:hypothetical protein